MEPSGPSWDSHLESDLYCRHGTGRIVGAEEPSCSLLLQMFVEERGGPEASQGSSLSLSPLVCFSLLRLPNSLTCWKTGCLLLLGNRGSHANGRDQSPRFRPGTRRVGREEREHRGVCVQHRGRCRSQAALAYPWPLPGIHLSVEWRVPVCSLSWLLVYTALGTLLRSMGRGRTTCSKDKYSGLRGRHSSLPPACQGLQHSPRV